MKQLSGIRYWLECAEWAQVTEWSIHARGTPVTSWIPSLPLPFVQVKCPPVLHCHFACFVTPCCQQVKCKMPTSFTLSVSCYMFCHVLKVLFICCQQVKCKMPTSFTLSVSCHMFCHVLKVLFVCREQAKCQNAHQFYTVILCVLPCLDGNIYVCLLWIVEIFCS